jgi:hypothetical protein
MSWSRVAYRIQKAQDDTCSRNPKLVILLVPNGGQLGIAQLDGLLGRLSL